MAGVGMLFQYAIIRDSSIDAGPPPRTTMPFQKSGNSKRVVNVATLDKVVRTNVTQGRM